MKNLNALDWIALILVVVGGLNWGLVGIFGFDLVAWIFASIYIVARIVYVLVAVAAIYMIIIAAMLRRK
ncbi:MAG: DUF378 domain-containing protein [Candidatus Coatesbacteria bacterium]|nr:MAG: DUF378 domain-containing protein [Candidatus Coatesbacteria bacterium]